MRSVTITAIALVLIAACATDDAGDDDGVAGNAGSAGSSGAGTTAGSSGTNTAGTGTTAGTGGSGTSGASTTGGNAGSVSSGGTAGGAGTTVAGGAGGTQSGGTGGGADAGMSGSGFGGSGATSGAAGTGGAGGSDAGGGFVTCPYTPPADSTMANFVAGTVTSFNDDGAWTWYCDERSIVDVAGGKIIVGSDANGGSRNGAIEAVIYDVASKQMTRTQLGKLAPDDHNVAAFLVKPDGKYLAAWAGHNENCNTYWSNHDGTKWADGKAYGWMECPFRDNRQVTYNNLWNMTAESKIYNFVRAIGTSPNVLTSSDNGATWQYGGRLSATPPTGYVAGYYKYWGNQVDRVDFFATEAHPRDYDNSLFHGYVKGGKTYDSKDKEIDASLSDGTQPEITAATKIFSTGTTVNNERFNHMWNSDIMRWDDGTIAAIGMGRTQNDGTNPDHSFLYFRFNGTEWKTTYLSKAGKKLYNDEQDYVGLGSLHPNDKRIVYISTPFDPRTSMPISKREIWQGVTCDEGATFQWTAITANSTQDNLRPIVPAWDANNMVLLWFRGTYQTAQIYDEEVVGLITTK